ncbi:MAG: MBL fold metallo-hydrolase, partial [Maribacter sp.]
MKKESLCIVLLTVILSFSCKDGKKSGKESDSTPEYSENVQAAPQNEIKNKGLNIIPIEHATAVLEWEGTTIYLDPTGGAAAFEGQK